MLTGAAAGRIESAWPPWSGLSPRHHLRASNLHPSVSINRITTRSVLASKPRAALSGAPRRRPRDTGSESFCHSVLSDNRRETLGAGGGT